MFSVRANLLFIAPLLISLTPSLPVVADDDPAAGVRLVGNTSNQALIALPSSPKHADFVAQGDKVGNVTVHLLQCNSAVLDVDGKRCDVQANPQEFSALWLEEFIQNLDQHIDQARPFQTETITFSVGPNGTPFKFNLHPTIAKAGPFQRLPANIADVNVKVTMSPGLPTRAEALSIDLK